MVSAIFLEHVNSFSYSRWEVLISIDHPISHEPSFDNAVEHIYQHPAHCNHSGSSDLLSFDATLIDPAFDDVPLDFTVDYFVDSGHNLVQNLFVDVVRIFPNVMGLYFIFLSGDELAFAEPFEAVL